MVERMSNGKRQISYHEFLEVVCHAPCQTLSGSARPSEGEAAYQYECQLAELVENPLYPVWFVNEAHTEFRKYDHPEARPIRAEALAALKPLVQPRLAGWYKPEAGAVAHASVIVLHCSSCDRRVLIDGVHRTMWLLSEGRTATMVEVTELSGARWPAETPDLNVVCSCHRR